MGGGCVGVRGCVSSNGGGGGRAEEGWLEK